PPLGHPDGHIPAATTITTGPSAGQPAQDPEELPRSSQTPPIDCTAAATTCAEVNPVCELDATGEDHAGREVNCQVCGTPEECPLSDNASRTRGPRIDPAARPDHPRPHRSRVGHREDTGPGRGNPSRVSSECAVHPRLWSSRLESE